MQISFKGKQSKIPAASALPEKIIIPVIESFAGKNILHNILLFVPLFRVEQQKNKTLFSGFLFHSFLR